MVLDFLNKKKKLLSFDHFKNYKILNNYEKYFSIIIYYFTIIYLENLPFY